MRVLGAAALCGALGACVTVAVPKLPTDELPAHWRNSPQLGPEPDLTGWWKHFDDPRLNALVEQALHDNLDVAQAALNLRAARALEDASGSTFKPMLAFNTLEQPNPQNTASYFQAGFDASWELGLFGRSGATGHLAQADTGAAAAELQSARVSLVAEVVREYLRLCAAQRGAALLTDAAHAAQHKLALVRVQAHLQMVSELAVHQAEAAAAQAEAALADPQAAIAQHAQTLALLLGRSEPEPAWLHAQPLPNLTAGNVTSVPADLLRTRPEIRYAEAQVVKAAGEAGIARADLYPRLALGSSLTFAALVKGHTRLGDLNNSFAIGPIIDLPLFDWKRRKAVKNAREDQLHAAVLGYRKAVLEGAAEVETDLAALHAARQRLTAADTAASASHASLALSEKLQGLGQADGLNVTDARLAFTEFELAREQARLAHGLAYVALYKALGGAPLPTGDGGDGSAIKDQAPGALPSSSGDTGSARANDGARVRDAGTPRGTEPSPLPPSRGERGKARSLDQP